jgi:hypothetical protein
MVLPDRIGGLIKRLEGGDAVTQRDVDRVVALQMLDLAKLGEDFAREQMQRNAALTESMRQSLADLGAP